MKEMVQSPMMPLGDTNIYKQSPQYSDALTADMMQQSRMENILTQIDPEHLLSDIEHRLRRMRKDHYTGSWVKIDNNQPDISPLLISNLISLLSSFLTKHITFSNYTEDEINRIMNLIVHDLIEDLVANAEAYELEDNYAERNRITDIICMTIFSSLKRALKGVESYRFWRSVSISGDVTNSDGGGQQKRKLGDYLKFW